MANNESRRCLRRVYNSRFSNDNPDDVAPKTTKWRIRKRQKINNIETDATFEDEYVSITNPNSPSSSLSVPPENQMPPSVEIESDDEKSPLQVLESEQEIMPHGQNDELDSNLVNGTIGSEADIQRDTVSMWESDERDEIQENDEHDSEDECSMSTGDQSINKALFDTCPVTTSESMLLIITFALRHDLTGECLSDLLKLIELHCPSPNSCQSSLYLLRKQFSGIKTPLVYHKFCNSCGIYIGKKEKQQTTCLNASCKKNLLNDKNVSIFIEISIEEQLKTLFQRNSFHKDLLHRYNRKQNYNHIEDIYDGELYKSYSKPGGFLSEENNFSLMWYTDGAQPFKSSKKSLWPVYFSINELPYKKRMDPDYILYAGLWLGEGKPSMSTYLKPICEVLNHMCTTGIDISCVHCCGEINVKLMVLGGTCDLPAKASVLNMIQYNGEFGCPKCKQAGKIVASGAGHTRVFPIVSENVDGPLRNHNDTVMSSIDALENNRVVYGIKGPSWFSYLKYHDIVKGTAIDYMHGVLLGVVRKLLHLWFDSKYSREQFSISKRVRTIDKRLLNIKPPAYSSRTTRSLGNHLAYWKANELRNWLNFYSVPVLHGILPEEYFQHHLLLVESMFILKASIPKYEIQHAKRVLIHYCVMFEELYGLRHMSINVHQMLNLADVVKELGPLWVYSCFTYESINGKLLKLIHAGHKPLSQIANAISIILQIPHLGEQIT